MTKDPVIEYIDSLPPPSQNNSREIARRAYEKSKVEGFGGYWSREFEEMSGIPTDRTAYDVGGEMDNQITHNNLIQ